MPTGGNAADDDGWFDLPDRLSFSLSDRLRGEFVSWFDPAGPVSNNGYSFFASRLRASVKIAFPIIDFFVEGQDVRLVNLPGPDSIAPGVGALGPGASYFANTRERDQGEVTLYRAFATLRVPKIAGLVGRFGRLGYNLGSERTPKDSALLWLQQTRISQRLIGNFEYTHPGRGFDGAQAAYDRGPFNFTLMASHPTFGGFNVNANQEIDDIDLVSAVGTLVEPRAVPIVSQLFYVYYRDRRDLVVTDNRALTPTSGVCSGADSQVFRSCDDDNINLSTVGGNITHAVDLGPGRLDLLGWVAGQFGDWESLDHAAWAYATEAGFQLPNVLTRPWVRLGFFRSSGDDDPLDGDHNTFFQLLPTARLYANFPFFNLMNNQDLFLQAILKPLPSLSVETSGHWLRTTEGADLWYAGGGATSDTFFGFSGIPARGARELAYLVDLALSWKAHEHLTLYGYYGHAFGQRVVAKSFVGDDADYGYIEATVSF
jgi:hypothetical protein